MLGQRASLDVIVCWKYRLELAEASTKLDKLYSEQAMQFTAMINFLDIDDNIKLLQESKP